MNEGLSPIGKVEDTIGMGAGFYYGYKNARRAGEQKRRLAEAKKEAENEGVASAVGYAGLGYIGGTLVGNFVNGQENKAAKREARIKELEDSNKKDKPSGR